MVFDVSILNGTIVDGTGKPRYRADVGISSGRVEAIGRLSDVEAERRIDAAGHVVAPHEPRDLDEVPRAEHIRQRLHA